MNKPRNGRDFGGWIALILAVGLSLTLLLVAVATLVFDQELSESGSRIVGTITAGLVGSLSYYLGHTVAERRKNGGGP